MPLSAERRLYLKAAGIGLGAFLVLSLAWILWSDHQRLNLIDVQVGTWQRELMKQAAPTAPTGK